MVRFHWHVEDGFNAYVPAGVVVRDKKTGVQHAQCDIELAGQTNPIPAIFTLPANYQQDGLTSAVGVILAHGDQADTFKGKLLTHLAVSLANAGHMVVRYYCAGKEQRRLRLFEKVLDAAALSPYARNIMRWVLGGIGSGSRICASVASRCRVNVAGLLLMAYPLKEPVAVFKGPQAPDSTGPLLKLVAPVLLVHAGNDELEPKEELLEVASRVPSYNVRLLTIENADGYFRDPQTHAPPDEAMRQRLAEVAVKFVTALSEGSLDASCDEALPRVTSKPDNVVPPPPPANLRQPLSLAPYHLLVQQHFRLAGGDSLGIQQLPGPLVNLLMASQQQNKQQMEILEKATAEVKGSQPENDTSPQTQEQQLQSQVVVAGEDGISQQQQLPSNGMDVDMQTNESGGVQQQQQQQQTEQHGTQQTQENQPLQPEQGASQVDMDAAPQAETVPSQEEMQAVNQKDVRAGRNLSLNAADMHMTTQANIVPAQPDANEDATDFFLKDGPDDLEEHADKKQRVN